MPQLRCGDNASGNKLDCCQVASVVSNSVRPHGLQPTRLLRPWDSPGKNTGVGCHFLLQCKKVGSESEVTQSCLTLSDPMDCSPPGSSIHGIFWATVLEWGAIAFSHKLDSLLLKNTYHYKGNGTNSGQLKTTMSVLGQVSPGSFYKEKRK